MKIFFATANEHKLKEVSEILGPDFEVLSPHSEGLDAEVEETGSTLKENSIIKAEHLHGLSGTDCFADDTGLEVDALGGAPGVYSARYAGPGHDNAANIAKLLRELERVGARTPEERKAHFSTVVTLIWKGRQYFFEGRLEGSIAGGCSGSGGFGYDPVFIPADSELDTLRRIFSDRTFSYGMTLAELREEEKNAISHRGKAISAMAEFLAKEICR